MWTRVRTSCSAVQSRSTLARSARNSAIISTMVNPLSARAAPCALADADVLIGAWTSSPCDFLRWSSAVCGVRRSAMMSVSISAAWSRSAVRFMSAAPSNVRANVTHSASTTSMLASKKSASRCGATGTVVIRRSGRGRVATCDRSGWSWSAAECNDLRDLSLSYVNNELYVARHAELALGWRPHLAIVRACGSPVQTERGILQRCHRCFPTCPWMPRRCGPRSPRARRR